MRARPRLDDLLRPRCCLPRPRPRAILPVFQPAAAAPAGCGAALPGTGRAEKAARKTGAPAPSRRQGRTAEGGRAAEVEGPPPADEQQLLRLSEIMGALAVLDPLCGDSGKAGSRESMQKLMDAQESGPMQRERLAGAYNRGLRGYTYFHRRCTASADLARSGSWTKAAASPTISPRPTAKDSKAKALRGLTGIGGLAGVAKDR